MLVVTMAFVACWIILVRAPDTPIGRLLSCWLVEVPAARLSRITQGDIMVCALILVGIGMMAFTDEGAKIRMVTMAVPDIGIWLTTFEVSAYLDVAVALVVAVSNLARRGGPLGIVTILARLVRVRERSRDRRTRPVRPKFPAANDEDDRIVVGRAA